MAQVIVIPFDGQQIGQGFNSQTRESIGTALSVASISADLAVDGQEVTTIFRTVTTQESLRESLGISASADVRYGLFSGGAKFDFADSHAVNSFSSFIAGRCEVHNAIRHGRGLKLTDDAEAILRSDMNVFKTAFGDMFVRSLKTGGDFYVIARITSVSEESQSKVSAALHAEYNGLATSGSFQAAFNQAKEETSSRIEVTVWMSQAGGLGAQASFTGPDATKILQRLSEFPQSVHEHPVGYEAVLATYNTIPIPVPTEEEREDREIALADCLKQKNGFLKALSDLDFALGPDADLYFDDLPPTVQLAEMQGQYRTALNRLMAHAIKIATGRMDPPQLFIADPIPPRLNLKKKPFSPPLPTIRLPNMLGVNTNEFEEVFQTLKFGFTVEQIMAGTAIVRREDEPGPIPPPAMGRARVEFVEWAHRGELLVKFVDLDPPAPVPTVVVAQFPSAGKIVAKGTEVTLQTRNQPP